jgi:hypothetical protein
MAHEEEHVGSRGIMDLIATLSVERASGRVGIVAGGNEGALLFKSGKLVDARIGHLTGFQAINAVASMRDARFHFDPSVAVPANSSITPSERLVLKQFFGIETAEPKDHSGYEPINNLTGGPTNALTGEPVETTPVYSTRPRLRYVAAFAFGVLLIAVVAAAMLLREKFRERNLPASVAARNESIAPPPPEQSSMTQEPRVNETPRVNDEAPIDREPREARANETPLAATPNLTGEWNVVNTVDTTAFRSFRNLQIGFAVSINQTGTTFTARGQKVSENGRSLPASSRTPIELKGSIKGDRIEATFSEQGTLRKTNGRLVWKINRSGGGLTGTFASSAARTSGKSTATREL